MKNKICIFILAAFACVCLTTCNNPVMKKWWEDENATVALDAEIYTVHFESNLGEPAPDDQRIAIGIKIVQPTAPIRDRYVLEGWYTTPTFDYDSGWNFVEYHIDQDDVDNDGVLTLYAKWVMSSSPYTVTFNNAGSAKPDPQTGIVGGKLIEPAAGTYGTYGFAGWYIDEECTTPWDFSAPVTRAGDMDLYAKWVSSYYTVTFNSDGGSPSPGDQHLAAEQTIREPPLMTKPGEAFDGWYTATGRRWIFSDPVTGNIDLEAHWTTNFYTVTFDNTGGTPATKDQIVVENGYLIEPAAGKNGTLGFAGWYTNKDYTTPWDFSAPVTGNMTLYAKWDPGTPTYTVTFNTNGGSVVPRDQIVVKGGYLNEPSAGTKTGYGFAGWYQNPEFTGNRWDFTKPVAGAITLYAKWEQNNQTIVVFNGNNGNPNPEPQVLAGTNKTIKEPEAMTKVGYGFGNWYENPDCTGDPWDFNNTVSGDQKILYAKWIPNLYTVTFVAEGGSPAPAAQKIPYSGKIDTPPPMTQEGEGFGGWFKSAEHKANQQWNFLTDTVTENITLYAYWDTAQYKIIFDSDGGSPVQSQDVVYGAKVIRPPDPTKAADPNGRDGYVFKGWYMTDKNDTNNPNYETLYDFDKPVTVTSTVNPTPITIYARYVFHNPMMAWIPGGTFSMGGLSGTGATTRPAHNVTVSGFYMFKAEITQYAFHSVHWWKTHNETLIGYNFDASTPTPQSGDNWAFNPSAAKGMYRPVESITWYDAVYFCNLVTEYENKVSRKGIDPFDLPYIITNIRHEDGTPGKGTNLADYSTNKSIVSADVALNPKLNPNDPSYDPEAVGYRLPTEAQWEYAARGGSGSPGNYLWAGSNTANDVAWYGGSGGNTTQTQAWGQKAPNQFEIYDMSGNVCEWCWDWYDKDYYKTSLPGTAVDPIGPAGSPDGTRTRRGGSIRHSADNCRTQVRDNWEPGKTDNWNIGFRLVRSGDE